MIHLIKIQLGNEEWIKWHEYKDINAARLHAEFLKSNDQVTAIKIVNYSSVLDSEEIIKP